MKKMRILTAALIFIFSAQCLTLHAQRPGTIPSHYQPSVEFLQSNYDGSITVRAWGTGRNKSAAIEQAYKAALHEILFHGINVRGQAPSMSHPLILENNAERKYQYFFDQFFSNRGAWKKFVSKQDTRGASNIRQRGTGEVRYGVTVRILRSELRQYLIQNNIIRP